LHLADIEFTFRFEVATVVRRDEIRCMDGNPEKVYENGVWNDAARGGDAKQNGSGDSGGVCRGEENPESERSRPGKVWPYSHSIQFNHIMAAPADFLNFVDGNKDRFIQRLARAVEIPRYPIDHLALAGPDTD
jgi:hypothetical protein